MTKIIFDTVPGGDDIFALLWLQSLAKQGLAELIAVTTAEGNINSKLTFTNASKVLSLGGFEQVELGRGITVKNPKVADAAHIHDMDGMRLTLRYSAFKKNNIYCKYLVNCI